MRLDGAEAELGPPHRPRRARRIFEVRKLYNDITFIDEFFTLEFCVEQKFYSFGFSERSGNWEIMSREFKKVKDQLLKMLTNRGQPVIVVEDGNFENSSELLLRHIHEGVDLDAGQARDTLRNASQGVDAPGEPADQGRRQGQDPSLRGRQPQRAQRGVRMILRSSKDRGQ